MDSAFEEVLFRQNHAGFEVDVVDLADIKRRSDELNPVPNEPHKVDFNLLILVETGQGYHRIDFEEVPYGVGHAIFIKKGQVQAFDFAGGLSGKVILYTNPFLDVLGTSLKTTFILNSHLPATFPPFLCMNQQLKNSVNALTGELQGELKKDSPLIEITVSLFGALIMMLARENAEKHRLDKVINAKFFTFQHLIEHDFNCNRNANDYADKLGMAYKTLNVLCKKVTGLTAKAYIDQRVILEAKRYLTIQQSDITSLAYELGFSDVTSFIKFFKRYVGMTPKQFRQKVRD